MESLLFFLFMMSSLWKIKATAFLFDWGFLVYHFWAVRFMIWKESQFSSQGIDFNMIYKSMENFIELLRIWYLNFQVIQILDLVFEKFWFVLTWNKIQIPSWGEWYQFYCYGLWFKDMISKGSYFNFLMWITWENKFGAEKILIWN